MTQTNLVMRLSVLEIPIHHIYWLQPQLLFFVTLLKA